MDVDDDGLFRGKDVGKQAEEKHAIVSFYAKLFSTGMKGKWDERVYIELYAGSGHSKIRDTSRIIAGSPLQALALEHPFDKYIFCETNPKALDALRARVERAAPSANVSYIEGIAIKTSAKFCLRFRLTLRGIAFYLCASSTLTTLESSSKR